MKEEPFAGFAGYGDGAAGFFHRGFHDVETDATTGDVGDFGWRSKSRAERSVRLMRDRSRVRHP